MNFEKSVFLDVQVLSADAVSQFASSASHKFAFDPNGLANQLRKEADAKPGCPFYNLEVFHSLIHSFNHSIMKEGMNE